MSEQKIDRDAKAKEIVTLLNGLSRDEAMSILGVTKILINVNSYIDVSKKNN
jgi:hypothetical protein